MFENVCVRMHTYRSQQQKQITYYSISCSVVFIYVSRSWVLKGNVLFIEQKTRMHILDGICTPIN